MVSEGLLTLISLRIRLRLTFECHVCHLDATRAVPAPSKSSDMDYVHEALAGRMVGFQ